MHLLHLTDLHLTQASKARRETLVGIWGQASQALPRRIDKFDFVLVTGDLTQAADEADYREVEAFFAELVGAHVRGSDPRRVVIVPGNHDVQWGASIGEPVDVRRLGAEPELRQEFKALLRSPQTSPLRMRLADNGAIDRLWRVREDAYGTRFKNFNDSLDRFYGRPLDGSPDRRFQLTSNDPAQHWSAHVFAEEKIAFFGFSSCHRNDRDWRGASIAHAAIDAARQHADAVAPLTGDWTRVLLWHHGLRSDWGTPDVLSTDDLGKLASLAPALGLHGHTHEDEITDLKEAARNFRSR